MSGRGGQRAQDAVYVPVSLEVTPGMLSELHAAANAAEVDVSRVLYRSFQLYKGVSAQRALFIDFEGQLDRLDAWREQAERDGTGIPAMVARAVDLCRYVRSYGHCPPNASAPPPSGRGRGRARG